MASTNPFQHANDDAIEGMNESIADLGVRGRRARRAAAGGQSVRRQKIKQRKAAARAAMATGFPSWEGLRPVVLFLLFPAMLGIAIALFGPLPKFVLYSLAGCMGVYLLASAFKDTELVLACFLLYVPFSTTYVIPIAPGVNGTNMLLLLGMFGALMGKVSHRRTFFCWPSGTTTIFIFAVVTALSGFTIMRENNGYQHLMYNNLVNYKAWLDQFIMYFIALSCIRTIEVAKRFVIYMCLGSLILTIYAVPEMLDKMGGSTIDKSRVGGPHQQPNMFGGFLAYSMLPVLAIFVVFIKDIRAWLLTPYFLLGAKMLVATFSRGAYLAMAVGGFMAAYYKGKGFLIFMGTMGICVLLVFPSLFPQAIKDRLFPESDVVRSSAPEKMDKSSEHRIILWRAGGKMILESPVLGKGFKGFELLKHKYEERPVHESDPHNMYIFIAAQMGLPALFLWLLIMAYTFHLGRKLSRNREDLFIRAIGIGGASVTVCYAAICVFGSRAVNLEFTAYFWCLTACMQVIDMCLRQKEKEEQPKKRRTNAYEDRENVATESGAIVATADEHWLADEQQPEPVETPPDTARTRRRARNRTDGEHAAARGKRRRLKHHRR